MSSMVGVLVMSVILGLVTTIILVLHIVTLMVFIFHPDKLDNFNKKLP